MKQSAFIRALLLFVIATSVTLYSCKKDDLPAVADPSVNNNDLTTKATAAVSGFVTDENNQRVAGASVVAGTTTTTTDQFGYFSISNVQLTKNAAFVTVTKSGYFNAIKTWIVSENNAAFFRIKLLPKTNAGSVSGTAGGTVTLAGGMKIVFPAAAFITSSTGAAYTGTVTVKAKWIDPSSGELNKLMPGDLRGKDASGNVKILTTYGMSAVELNGSAGELLQIAPGKKATLTVPIPVSLQASAPATIPLWYFDESLGLWKEEGSATKSGTEYSGDVSHFSFWNYDAPANYVQFNVTVNDAGGNPVQNAMVIVTSVGTGIPGTGYTNASGYTGGAVPNNSNFTLAIYAGISCSTVLYSQNFSTGTANVSLGTITLNSNRTIRISGNLTDCSNAAVTNGKVAVVYDNQLMIVNANATGQYTVSIPVCSGTSISTVLTGYDAAYTVQSISASNTYAAGSVNTSNLQLCTTYSLQEFLTYSYSNNVAYAYNGAQDSVYNFPSPGAYNYYIRGVKMPNSTSISSLYIPSAIAPVVGQVRPVGSLNDPSVPFGSTYTGSVTYNEVGPPLTGFIGGTFSGAVTPPGGIPVSFTGSFRMRRPY